MNKKVSSLTFRPLKYRPTYLQKCNTRSQYVYEITRCRLNRWGFLNRKIGELPEPEKDAVWRRIQNRLKRRSQYRQKSSGNSQKKRNTDRSEVAVTMDQTKKFVKTPDDASESSSN